MDPKTQPLSAGNLFGTAPTVMVPASYTDPTTGAVFVHEALHLVTPAWEVEEHISPPKGEYRFGDIDSFARYVTRYALPGTSLLTWTASGLRCVVDHHEGLGAPGACQWIATMPFRKSTAWQAWEKLAGGQPIKQGDLVERLDDLHDDIKTPDAATVVELLRSLKANASAEARTEIRPDGTASIAWSTDRTVTGGRGGELLLPERMGIAIFVLAGDTVLTPLDVRLRVSVDDAAKLWFRLSLVNPERALEAVYADRVTEARQALGEQFTLLRASDS